jgi:hypothetical protein
MSWHQLHMKPTGIFRSVLLAACWLLSAWLLPATAAAEPIPALREVPANLAAEVKVRLADRRQELQRQLTGFLAEADRFNAKKAEDQADEEYAALLARRKAYVGLAMGFNREVGAAEAAVINESTEAVLAEERGRFAKDHTAWMKDARAGIQQRLQEPNRLCAAIQGSLKSKEPPLPYKTLTELQPGDVLLIAPDDFISNRIHRGDKFSSWEPKSPASHTVLYVKEVKGKRLFLDNRSDEGPSIITEEEFLKRYASRLPSSGVASLRQPGCDVAQPLSKAEGDRLWTEAGLLARQQLASRERKADNLIDTSNYGLYGDDNMVCSEASRWALVRALAPTRPEMMNLPVTASPIKKALGIYYGPANFYGDQEHFLVSPLGVPLDPGK